MTQKKNENPYLERDISWMYFNKLILQEADNFESKVFLKQSLFLL